MVYKHYTQTVGYNNGTQVAMLDLYIWVQVSRSQQKTKHHRCCLTSCKFTDEEQIQVDFKRVALVFCNIVGQFKKIVNIIL